MQVQPDTKPSFWKVRSVSFSVQESIDQELERLESCGISKPVPHSEWVAPILTLSKNEGRFRVCDEYKVTINPVLDVKQYPET